MRRHLLSITLLVLLFPVVSSSSLTVDQINDDPYEPDDGFLSATPIEMGEVQVHTLTSGDEDYFTFILNETLTIEIYTFNSNDDLWMELYNSGHAVIRSDDDSGIGANPRIIVELQNGTYFFMVRHLGYSSSPEYSVTFNLIPQDEDEPNNTKAAATYLPFNTTYHGLLFYNYTTYQPDIDWFIINITESRSYVITLYSQEYLEVNLYNSYSTSAGYFTTNYLSEGYLSQFNGVLAIGNYFIQITTYSTVTYELKLEYILPDQYEPNNDRSSATPLYYNESRHATIHYNESMDLDWWEFNVTESSAISIQILTNMSSLSAELTDSDGSYYGNLNYDYTQTSRYLRLSIALEPGTYNIQVKTYDIRSGSYDIIFGPVLPDQYEPNDSSETATPFLEVSDRGEFWFSANFHTAEDEDWFYLEIDYPATLNLQIYSNSYYYYNEPNLQFSFYDENLNEIATETGNSIDLEIEVGIYYLKLTQIDRTLEYSGYFTLLVADSFEYDDDYTAATRLTRDNTQFHTLHTPSDVDWFYFEISDEKSVDISTYGYRGGDPEMRLFSESLSELVYNDDSGGDVFPRIRRVLEAGTYYVQVNPFGYSHVVGEYYITLSYQNPTQSSDDEVTTAKLEIGYSLHFTLTVMFFAFVSINFIKLHRRKL